ncbi:MAG TPA: DUF998 domain-containing protein [Candidatus Saccharimonadales bacterium]|nr:DUF998 domain-containing protein [Candidatus Saccharimonadales bacterium]
MTVRQKVAIFTDKYPLIGPLVWVLTAQYFAAQIIVAHTWPAPGYSWSKNAISDLGNTTCYHPDVQRFICSPDHAVMNASFILLGLTMALGSLLIYQEFNRSRASLAGFSLMALAGVGTVLVGLFPENTVTWVHFLGAFLALAVGNISLIILGLSLDRVRPVFRLYTLISGLMSFGFFGLFAAGIYLGLGLGGMERLAGYPQTTWLILFGLYMTGSHYRRHRQRA